MGNGIVTNKSFNNDIDYDKTPDYPIFHKITNDYDEVHRKTVEASFNGKHFTILPENYNTLYNNLNDISNNTEDNDLTKTFINYNQ
mmetsp:Transcript_2655/g.2337  ORF Transcript_2655/g.2337 Transcript_2655/m.2337 type:complete len:86 (+) Transcript_2655:58-315(+)